MDRTNNGLLNRSLPDELDIEEFSALYWAIIDRENSVSETATFFDLSKGKPDPPFRYLVIGADRIESFEEHYLLCYFDEQGKWITQSPFDTLEEAFKQGEFAFKVERDKWFKVPDGSHSQE